MTNDESITKAERRNELRAIQFLPFVIPSTFDIRGSSFKSRLLLQALNDADERQEERDHDRADDERKKYNHDRLERRSHGRNRVVYFVVVNIRDFQKHLGQLTGFFADIDHADDHRWKRAAGFKRLNDRLAFLHAFVHLANRARDHHVASGFPGNVEGLQDWNATGDERSERALTS